MTNPKANAWAHGLQGDRECVPEPWGMPQDPTSETRDMTMRAQNQTTIDVLGRHVVRGEMDWIFGRKGLEETMEEKPPFGAEMWCGRLPPSWTPQMSSFANGLMQLCDHSFFT